jgi:hypothetical protein
MAEIKGVMDRSAYVEADQPRDVQEAGPVTVEVSHE